MAEAIFWATGENRRWLSDCYSLSLGLKEVGFTDIKQMSPFTSRERWLSFHPDTEPDKIVSQAGSLSGETVKPRLSIPRLCAF
jgi:hypothetical protein